MGLLTFWVVIFTTKRKASWSMPCVFGLEWAAIERTQGIRGGRHHNQPNTAFSSFN
jgi:hypothetical protein